MKKVLILGAGGTSQDLLDFIADVNQRRPSYECLGFLDDDPARHGTVLDGLPILGPISRAAEMAGVWLLDGLGSPQSYGLREQRLAALQLPEGRFETLAHPTAVVSSTAEIGPGSILYPFVTVGAHASLGRHVTVLSHSVVNHHARVGDFSILASSVTLSGRARIGRSCYLGAGCSVVEDGEVGEGSLVGMGAVVVEPVPPLSVVVGNPARKLREVGADR